MAQAVLGEKFHRRRQEEMWLQGGSGGGGGGPALAFLRNNPQFQGLRQVVQGNPAILQPMLQELGRQNPQLLALINDNQVPAVFCPTTTVRFRGRPESRFCVFLLFVCESCIVDKPYAPCPLR